MVLNEKILKRPTTCTVSTTLIYDNIHEYVLTEEEWNYPNIITLLSLVFKANSMALSTLEVYTRNVLWTSFEHGIMLPSFARLITCGCVPNPLLLGVHSTTVSQENITQNQPSITSSISAEATVAAVESADFSRNLNIVKFSGISPITMSLFAPMALISSPSSTSCSVNIDPCIFAAGPCNHRHQSRSQSDKLLEVVFDETPDCRVDSEVYTTLIPTVSDTPPYDKKKGSTKNKIDGHLRNYNKKATGLSQTIIGNPKVATTTSELLLQDINNLTKLINSDELMSNFGFTRFDTPDVNDRRTPIPNFINENLSLVHVQYINAKMGYQLRLLEFLKTHAHPALAYYHMAKYMKDRAGTVLTNFFPFLDSNDIDKYFSLDKDGQTYWCPFPQIFYIHRLLLQSVCMIKDDSLDGNHRINRNLTVLLHPKHCNKRIFFDKLLNTTQVNQIIPSNHNNTSIFELKKDVS